MQHLVAEALTLLLGCDHCGYQILARLGTPPLHLLRQVLPKLDERKEDLVHEPVVDQWVEAAGRRACPPAALVVVFHRQPQHLADHRRWKREGEVADDVHPSVLPRDTERVVHDVVDPSPQALKHTRREGFADQRAQPGVGWRIAKQHRLPIRRTAFSGEALGDLMAEAGIAQQGGDIVVAGEDPEVDLGPVDRILLSQFTVVRVRIGMNFGVERVVDNAGDGFDVFTLCRCHRSLPFNNEIRVAVYSVTLLAAHLRYVFTLPT